jgi:nucleotide-binding universal stress UspA family protein
MELPLRKIVVPVDFSEDSLAAVTTALRIAAAPSDVYVVHVLAEPHTADPAVVWQAMDSEIRREQAEQALRECLTGDEHAGLQIQIEFGDAGFRIAAFAEQIGADLIVMPSHGRTGLKRLLIGSVAERVVRLAHCAVLVLRQ